MKITHVVVDGSNIATEGRDAPSLSQLDEAVRAFVEEYGPKHVTVVVDATFPNRIDRKERKTYEEAVSANELITPPAGAIGRGDAFVLQIAKRAGAAILSNDSFQEFHGDYPWLFDRGRLIGGKPVPHVGWVFMDRAPVRGPTSRRAVSEAKKMAKAAEQAAEHVVADLEGPEAAAPAPRRRRSKARAVTPAPAAAAASDDGRDRAESAPAAGGAQESGGRSVAPYNDALPFIEFVAQHPVGTEVDATIERFSSHGAYVTVGSARGYLPLGNLADPAPRSAKEVLRVGEERRLVVVAIDPPRRGIDLAVPGVVDVPAPDLADAANLVAELAIDVTDAAEEIERAADEIAAAGDGLAGDAAPGAAAKKARARKATTRKATAAAGPGKAAAGKATAAAGPGKAAAGKATAAAGPGKAAATKAPRKHPTADEPAATKAAARKARATVGKATASKATAAEATAGKAAAKKATPRKATGERATAADATAGKVTPKGAPTRKATAAEATGGKVTPKGAPARKATAKRSSAPRGATGEAAPGAEAPPSTAREGGGEAAPATRRAPATRAAGATRRAASKRTAPPAEAGSGDEAATAGPDVAKRSGRARKAAADAPEPAPAPAAARAPRSTAGTGAPGAARKTAGARATSATQGAGRAVPRGGAAGHRHRSPASAGGAAPEPAAPDSTRAAPAPGGSLPAPTGS